MLEYQENQVKTHFSSCNLFNLMSVLLLILTLLFNFSVFKRPSCEDFLAFCFKRFDVGIWSSRLKYVRMTFLFPLTCSILIILFF